MAVLTKRKNISKSKSNYKTRKQFKRFRKSGSKTRKIRGGAGFPKTTIPDFSILTNFEDILNKDNNIEHKIKVILDIIMNNHFEIIIILGAHSSEKHIIRFVNSKKNSIVICFAETPTNNSGLTTMYLNQAQNSCSISFVADFNDINIWKELNTKIKINEIICDWSVAKFLKDEYNFINGKIMDIIFEILVVGGKYYSSCCYSSSIIVEENNSKLVKKKLPLMYSYAYIPVKKSIKKEHRNNYNTQEIKTEHVAEEWNDLLPYVEKNTVYNTTKYIDKYKNHLQDYKPLNFTIEFITSESKETDVYPLHNSSRIEYPHTYFYLEKTYENKFLKKT